MLIWFFKFFSSSVIAHEASFVLQHNPDGKCFHKDTKGYVYRGVYTCDYEKQSFHWIYTKYQQLLHWETLKCMTDEYDDYRNKHLVVLKECDKDKQEQLWQCVDDKKNTIMKVNSSKYITYRNRMAQLIPSNLVYHNGRVTIHNKVSVHKVIRKIILENMTGKQFQQIFTIEIQSKCACAFMTQPNLPHR